MRVLLLRCAAPALLLAFATSSCSHANVPDVLPTGTWGGEHVGLEVSAGSTRVEFDCAHGTVDGPWPIDRDGTFHVDGEFVREHGGPVHEGEPDDVQPAVYSGRLEDASRLTLTTQLADGTRVGPFTAVLGRTANVFKCL